MSYCRWSDDDFQCDVYVYEDVNGGWTTHVATNRSIFTEAMPPPLALSPGDEGWAQAWVDRNKIVYDIVDRSPRESINLPYAGESFNDPTPGACANRLEELARLGYVVPQYAIDELRAEAEQLTDQLAKKEV